MGLHRGCHQDEVLLELMDQLVGSIPRWRSHSIPPRVFDEALKALVQFLEPGERSK
tara:strand:- start:59 stop:226 length:168 start_codon:yes stop_codon:yes gene_type:complete